MMEHAKHSEFYNNLQTIRKDMESKRKEYRTTLPEKKSVLLNITFTFTFRKWDCFCLKGPFLRARNNAYFTKT